MAATRNGSSVEFTLDKMLLVHLLNEKDILCWLAEKKRGIDSDLDEVQERITEQGEEVIFIKDTSRGSRVRELLYSGPRQKAASSVRQGRLIPGSSLKELDNELSRNVGLVE